MSKIIVEDLTRPEELTYSSEESIPALREALFVGAVQSSGIFRAPLEDAALAMLQAAEDLLYFADVMEELGLEKILAIRKKAIEAAISKREKLSNDQLFQEIVKTHKENKRKAIKDGQ